MSFFLACEDFGGRFDDSFPVRAFFFFFFMEICSHTHTPVPLLGQDQSTVAQWAEMTEVECSLTSCVWACYPNRFPYYATQMCCRLTSPTWPSVKALIVCQALLYDRQTLTSPLNSVLCLLIGIYHGYSHQTQDTVRQWSKSLSAPISSVCFVPLLYDRQSMTSSFDGVVGLRII